VSDYCIARIGIHAFVITIITRRLASPILERHRRPNWLIGHLTRERLLRDLSSFRVNVKGSPELLVSVAIDATYGQSLEVVKVLDSPHPFALTNTLNLQVVFVRGIHSDESLYLFVTESRSIICTRYVHVKTIIE